MTDNRLLELAERVEAATGPDRELDRCLFAVLHGVERDRVAGPMDFSPTASLDAAMSLVPEGFRLERLADTTPTIQSWQTGPWVAQLATDDWPRPRRYGSSEHGSSPALVLTAAALRARANGEGL